MCRVRLDEGQRQKPDLSSVNLNEHIFNLFKFLAGTILCCADFYKLKYKDPGGESLEIWDLICH